MTYQNIHFVLVLILVITLSLIGFIGKLRHDFHGLTAHHVRVGPRRLACHGFMGGEQ